MPLRFPIPRLTCVVLTTLIMPLGGCENDIEANTGASGIEVGTSHAAGGAHGPSGDAEISHEPAPTTQPAGRETTAPPH